MGSSKTSETSQTSGQQTIQPTAEETELNRLRLEREKFLDPFIRAAGESGLDLSNLLLTGQELPGFLSDLPGGITPEVSREIGEEAVRVITPSFQQGGLLDSGVRASVSGRVAGDVLRESRQFNLQNLQQLLNIAVGGQAAPLAGPIGFGGQLAQSLAGLRGITTTGTGSGTGRSSVGFFQPGGFGQALIGAGGTALSGSNFGRVNP